MNSVKGMDIYAELQAALNPKSLYSIELNVDLKSYIKMIVNELTVFFKSEHQKSFRKNVRTELKKILNKDKTDREKMSMIRKIVKEQLQPQIQKYIIHEFGVVGELQMNTQPQQIELNKKIQELLDSQKPVINQQAANRQEVDIDMYNIEQ